MPILPPSTLAALACPACHGPLGEQPPSTLACTRCGRIYPVRDGIPVLIPASASSASQPDVAD